MKRPMHYFSILLALILIVSICWFVELSENMLTVESEDIQIA